MRQIVVDTETTGLSAKAGHRIIEIGCVELINRRFTKNTFHCYLQPDREIDPGAMAVHGITNEFLLGKPRFHEVMGALKTFLQDSELIIHNAPFDVSFLENEFLLAKESQWATLSSQCNIVDTLAMARKKHPGQRNNLDALCKRYNVDSQHREKHGALLDANLLASVYLAMTGGQNALVFDSVSGSKAAQEHAAYASTESTTVKVIYATEDELKAHKAFLDQLQ